MGDISFLLGNFRYIYWHGNNIYSFNLNLEVCNKEDEAFYLGIFLVL